MPDRQTILDTLLRPDKKGESSSYTKDSRKIYNRERRERAKERDLVVVLPCELGGHEYG